MHSERLEQEPVAPLLEGVDGILVCPGFGERGIEGKLEAARYARENKIPYLGVCLGLQMMVIEYARNVLGLLGANSTEVDPHTPYPVISMLSEQLGIEDMGGTMRLGGYPCKLVPGTKAAAAYGVDEVVERHRHRYEFNNAYRDAARSGRTDRQRHARRTAGWSRSASSSTTRSCSARSSTPSSGRAPTGRSRCSGTSSAPRDSCGRRAMPD